MAAHRTLVRVVLALAALCATPTASAGLADETALAERYAPVVRVVEQPVECGPGEPYEPLDVDTLFDQPTVGLFGPWGGSDLVQVGPSAEDLAGGLYDYHLDFPGDALDPGCSFELWGRRISDGVAPAVYAHVATDPRYPGQLALQYWIFYVYNDWNNLHEGDWEMIQLNFDAADAREALSREPTSVGYSQHEGAERADWDAEKLELVDGTHPVVYPAAGSHANFYGDALYLGSSAQQGVGCDDTRGPHDELRPVAFTIPSDSAAARTAFPWIEFQGRWGELQPAFFNGPTGPNLKTQWTEPIRWSEGWRERSFTVPAGGAFGRQATDFFCEAIAVGSRSLVRLVDHPLELGLVLAGIVALVGYGLARATWRPAAPLRLARRRAWGQILAASTRMYVGRFRLFVGIGLVFIPLSLLLALLQSTILGATSILGVQTGDGSDGLLSFFVFAISTALTLLGLGVVQAATARALVAIDAGRPIGAVSAYRLASDSIRPLAGALLVAVVAVSLLASSIYLIPIAVWLAGRWSLIAPVIELEGASAATALRRSARLVRRRWLKVSSLIVLGGGLALLAGPIVGFLLIVATEAPFWLVNLLAGATYAVTMPLVAITTTYVYADRKAAGALASDEARGVLPAEVELSS